MSAQTPAEAMLVVADLLAIIVEQCAGYRAQLEAAGFSPTASEAMVMDLHRDLVHSCFQSKT